ncbi:MAG: hypothetical protein E7434_02380 [Ruminococcaceae bacterium]|nr:hypothetical protein [Oscillospiraceae bacterium]
MKRPYQKPYLGLESFQLNAAVAAACSTDGYTPIRHREDDCTFDNGQFYNLFNCQVDLTGPANDGNDTICYHGPTASQGQIFTWS